MQNCESHEETLRDHEKRIHKLEISEATFSERLVTLFNKIDELTWWMKALVMMSVTYLLGFLFWFIQSIGIKAIQ